MKPLTWSVDEAVHPREAVLAACYRFAAAGSFSVRRAAGVLRVSARPRAAARPGEWEELAEGFENELIHQTLRLGAVAAGGKIRECIVLRALASAEGASEGSRAAGVDGRLEAQMEALAAAASDAGPGEDPLGVLKEWAPEGKEAAP